MIGRTKISPCEYLYFPELCKSREKPISMKHFYLAKTHPSLKHQILKNNLRTSIWSYLKSCLSLFKFPLFSYPHPWDKNASLNIQRVHPGGRIDAAGLRLNHTVLFGGFIFMTPSQSFAPQGKSVQEGQNTGVAYPSSQYATPASECSKVTPQNHHRSR